MTGILAGVLSAQAVSAAGVVPPSSPQSVSEQSLWEAIERIESALDTLVKGLLGVPKEQLGELVGGSIWTLVDTPVFTPTVTPATLTLEHDLGRRPVGCIFAGLAPGSGSVTTDLIMTPDLEGATSEDIIIGHELTSGTAADVVARFLVV